MVKMQEFVPGQLRQDPKMTWKDDFVLFFEVEKGGILDFADLYMYVNQWLVQELFVHWQSGDKTVEDFHLHRIRADGVQENLFWWRAVRRVNNYCYYMCKMDWQNFGAKQTEILYNDQKVKAHKIGITIRLWWWVQWDPYNKWEKTFLGKWQKWFFTWLRTQDMEDHRDKLKAIAHRLENDLKAYMEVATDVPTPRTFFPEEGYKWKRPKPKPEEFQGLPRKPDWQI